MTHRHDRTIRFLQAEMGWEQPPSGEALLNLASQLEVTVRIPPVSGGRQRNLLALATGNVVGRLPVGALRFQVAPGPLMLHAHPYHGDTIRDALGDLTEKLGVASSIDACDATGPAHISISVLGDNRSWAVAVDGPAAYLGRAPQASTSAYDPVGPYAAASMIGGEVIRTLARSAATAGAGAPGPVFTSRTAPSADRWLCLVPPNSRPSAPVHDQPIDIDWVSCGAVNQGVLAVLAASPDFEVSGTVYDPGILDEPDLNRSLLSFPEDLGRPKARLGATVAESRMSWVQGRYPDGLSGANAPWIVCGTDDPSARPACQQLWPDRLVVTATENVFGYIGWHSADAPHAFCGACQPAPPLPTGVPIPTSAPTSLITAVAAAAVTRSLARGGRPTHRLDLLTLRLDSKFAVERSNPPPSPDCPACGGPRSVLTRLPR